MSDFLLLPDCSTTVNNNSVSGVFLGRDAKYKNSARIDPETGEILGVFDPMAAGLERFALQSVARKFLPKTRTDNCLRVRSKGMEVQVLKSKEHEKCFYGGLQTCGSVWACPVCAAKIAERRRVEIQGAMAIHKAAGGVVEMLTLTAPHQKVDKLADLLEKQAKALNAFWSDRVTKAVLADMGVVGQIRALEVTHGRLSEVSNGWHPHYHVLLFAGVGVDLERFNGPQMHEWETVLYLVWTRKCERAGLGVPSRLRGLKLDDGSKAAAYVCKIGLEEERRWGPEDELTKGHTKKARSGETPFDFLRAYLADKNDKQAGALFKEFAETFKGKRQLHWSKGLKKRFAVVEKTDDEIVQDQDDSARLLGALTVDQWRDVLAIGGRGVLLAVAAAGGWSAVDAYLASIRRGVAAAGDVDLMIIPWARGARIGH